jgi:hypothetical protein
MRGADAGFDLDSLAVVETLRFGIVIEIHAHAGAGAGIELESELFAGGGEDGGFDYASLEEYDFAGAGVDGWRRAGAVPGICHCSNEKYRQDYAGFAEPFRTGREGEEREGEYGPSGFSGRESEQVAG